MLQLFLNLVGQKMPTPVSPPLTRGKSGDPFIWKHGIRVHIVARPRARRYLLRLQPDGSARLVLPRRGSKAEALRFLERSEAWLLKRRAQWEVQTRPESSWSNGTRFPFRGEEVALRVEQVGDQVTVKFAEQCFSLPSLAADLRDAVHRHLRRLAERELPVRTLELAKLHGTAIKRVTVRAQKTRWGSCSTRGTISLNWRLIHAPPFVADYIIVHELMHRREMNHSARYWKLVAAAFPEYERAECWLKETRLYVLR